MLLTPVSAVKPPLAGYRKLSQLQKPYINGYLIRGLRQIPCMVSTVKFRDRLEHVGVQWGIRRNSYMVLPGLYAAGSPGRQSPVLVTANYKLSFDMLRRELAGLDVWLLVLDTTGVNVWCAAGKGSFGTAELLRKLQQTRLDELVDHRQLILPQLGAVGVSAPEVLRRSGWRIAWGPVRAADLKAFLAAGLQKTAGMSRVRFGLGDRLRVAPLEMVQAWPLPLAAVLAAALAAWLGGGRPWDYAWKTLLALGALWPLGSWLFPALLPVLPSRAFSVKGAVLGLLWALCMILLLQPGFWFALALILVSTSVTSFKAMNFTGATTFTSQTGAMLEVDKAIIPQLAGFAAAVVFAAIGFFAGFGV